jgi:hypothetical protein
MLKSNSPKPLAFIGVDPGRSGGMACIMGGKLLAVSKTPDSEDDVLETMRILAGFGLEGGGCRAVIELVQGYIGRGVTTGTQMFNFGRSYGTLRMALVACGFREGETFVATQPHQWQKTIGIKKRDEEESRTEFKNRLKAKAIDLFPMNATHITLSTCDAVLIAEYCRIRYGG